MTTLMTASSRVSASLSPVRALRHDTPRQHKSRSAKSATPAMRGMRHPKVRTNTMSTLTNVTATEANVTNEAGIRAKLAAWAAPRLQAVENALEEALPVTKGPAADLHEAMRYAALGNGKRLRPLLCIAAAEICGAQAQTVLPTACAIEMIHSFSLVHDDLPCMDNDALRRGRPTCHIAFGEATAVLGGDALLVEAFGQIAAQGMLVPTPRALRVLKLLCGAAGANGMAGGQIADMQAEGKACDADTLAFIHTHKTGDMIRASLEAGAILAGAGDRAICALQAYGDALGHLFQIVDDILNACGDADRIGKAVGSDSERGKATYPALLGLEGARQAARDMACRALNALEGFGSSADPLRWMAAWALERDR